MLADDCRSRSLRVKRTFRFHRAAAVNDPNSDQNGSLAHALHPGAAETPLARELLPAPLEHRYPVLSCLSYTFGHPDWEVSRQACIMMTVLLVAVAAGAACGSARLKVWALIPAIAIYSMITIIEGIVTGLGAGTIALSVVIGATLLQLFYLIGWLLLEEQKRPAPAPRPLRPELASRDAICNRPRTENALPFAAGFAPGTGRSCGPIEGTIRIKVSLDVRTLHDERSCKVQQISPDRLTAKERRRRIKTAPQNFPRAPLGCKHHSVSWQECPETAKACFAPRLPSPAHAICQLGPRIGV